MIRQAAITALLVLASFSVSPASPGTSVHRQQEQQPKTEPQEKTNPKGQAASLTGCIDEQNGKWVLVSDQTMAVIANLAAEGFPTEGFAKYLGQKVNVRGTGNSGASSTFRVREIKTIRETCAAQ